MNPESITGMWRRWVSKTTHPYIPFSNLRNSYSTMLHERGLDQAVVSKLMRHSTLSTDYAFCNRQDAESLIEVLKSKNPR